MSVPDPYRGRHLAGTVLITHWFLNVLAAGRHCCSLPGISLLQSSSRWSPALWNCLAHEGLRLDAMHLLRVSLYWVEQAFMAEAASCGQG